MTSTQQFDSDYKQLRLFVVQGKLSVQEAKDWIRSRGLVTAVMVDDERAQLAIKMCSKRVDLDIPILDEGED